MAKQNEFTLIDLFSGAGGLSEGFKKEGFEPILGVEIDPYAARTYEKNHGHALQCDIRDLSVSKLKKITGRKVNVISAGPPCQAFSSVAIAKLRSLNKSTTTRNPLNKLYQEVLRIVKGLEPDFVVMENVGRMFSIGDGAIKKEIEKQLKNKYNVTFYYENVADLGIPQARKRGLLIANKLGVENPVFPKTHFNPTSSTYKRGQKKHITVKEAIHDLPRIQSGGGNELMEYRKIRNLTDYEKERRHSSRYVINHTARNHSDRDKKIFKKLLPGQRISDLPSKYNPYRKDIFPDKIKKQYWDKPSSTILAHLSKDGLMFIHPDSSQNRTFTPREAARLQSFDDTFVFEGPRTQQYLQIGNAVPPLFAQTVAREIYSILKN
jgi:DNA (cytosine-5)-methyltransferase 1